VERLVVNGNHLRSAHLVSVFSELQEVAAMRVSSIRLGLWGIAWPLAIVVSAMLANASWAQAPDVTRIEEDWELVIGVPSPNSDAPQVTCLIAPVGNVESLYTTFIVNHHNVPSFIAGGLQLQTWNGKTLLASKRYPDQAVLTTPGETIRWTQVMRLTSDGLVFEVVNGASTTWGAFGAEGTIKTTVSTTLGNLNGYNPAVSVENSGVSYAANRVQSLVLKRVRAYGAAGLIAEDNSPRVVYSLNE
jgi:hypothetical protein